MWSSIAGRSATNGRLPVMKEVECEARRHKVKLLILPTIKAIEVLQIDPADTNAIIHVTC